MQNKYHRISKKKTIMQKSPNLRIVLQGMIDFYDNFKFVIKFVQLFFECTFLMTPREVKIPVIKGIIKLACS